MATQIRGTSQIKDLTINHEKLEADFLNGTDLNITDGNNDATITGLGVPTNSTDAATKQYVDQLVDGSLKTPEAYNASVNAYPSTYGGAAIQAGDSWRITVAGTMGTRTVNVEDLLIALVDAAGADADFIVAESNRDQATETVKGVAELATQTETDTGTNDTNIITPLKLTTFISDLNINKVAGAGLIETAGTFDIVATDNSITVNADDLGVNIGNTNGDSLEVTATGLELRGTITGERVFNVGATNNFDIIADADLSTLSSQPTGAVPLAIATTQYVDNITSKIFEVDQEDFTLVSNIASGSTVYTLTDLGTHATVKVKYVKAYVNGVLQKVADTTVNTSTGAISFNFNLVTGDEVSFVYSKQNA